MKGFNLKREASPLATAILSMVRHVALCFNLKREASPLATKSFGGEIGMWQLFQSQARSQSPSDKEMWALRVITVHVSISSEKPVP